MTRGGWLVFALLSACSGEAERPPARPEPPQLTCPEGLSPDGPACVPTTEPCANGACAIASCATGLELAKEGGCRAILPDVACPRGQLAVPGDAACRPIDACGEGTFGDIPDEAGTVYVDAAATAPFEGTRARPFRTINDARASKAAAIGIAAGTYVEDLVFDRPVRLRGRCPSLVTLRSASESPDTYALTFLAEGRVRGISVTGGGRGAISGAASLTVERVELHGLSGRGVSFFPTVPATLRVSDARIDGAQLVGIVGRGAMLVERTVVQNVTLEGDDALGVQVSADAATPGELTLDRVLIERVTGAALDVVGARAKLQSVVIRELPFGVDRGAAIDVRRNPMVTTLRPGLEVAGLVIERVSARAIGVSEADAQFDGLTIRDVRAIPGRGGIGLSIFGDAKVVARGVLIDRAAYAGVLVDGGDVRLERATIKRTAVAEELGVGVLARKESGGFKLHVQDSAIVDNERVGIALGGGDSTILGCDVARNRELGLSLESARATITATTVQDTLPTSAGGRGVGISVTRYKDKAIGPASDVVIERSTVRRCTSAGVSVFASRATIRDSAIEDIGPEPRSESGGVGVLGDAYTGILEPSKLTIERTRIARVHAAGIVGLGADLTIARALVRDVSALAARFGDGIVVSASEVDGELLAGSAAIASSRIERAARAGLAVFGSTATLEGTKIDCAAIAINLEHSFGTLRRARNATLTDGGGNECGCGAAAKCSAASSGLQPAPVAR